MRANVGAKTITTKQHISAKQRIPFALEKQSFRQAHNFVAAVRKPFFKMRLFTLPLRKTKFPPNNLLANQNPCIRRENHVRNFCRGPPHPPLPPRLLNFPQPPPP